MCGGILQRTMAGAQRFRRAAYLKNLTIVHENVIEENKKIVNEIYLFCEMNDTLPDSLQTITLQNIAYQYPSTGGEAVYWARAILHLDIEDQLISLRRRNLESEKRSSYGKLYPNPAENVVYYEYPIKEGASVVFEIYDQLNKKILFLNMNATILTINTSNLPNGVYNYRLILDGKVVDHNKLVIVK